MNSVQGRCLALLLICAAGAAHAADADAVAGPETAAASNGLLDQTAAVDIGPQSTSTAILALSRQFAFQAAMASDSLAGQTTQGLHGQMTLRAALDQLLQASGYSYQQSSDSTITIVSPAAAAAAEAAASVATIAVPPSPAEARAASELAQDAGDGAQRLDDVVVTATKRPQRLRDIPQSITEMNGDDLERRGVQNLQDIVKLVPGVNLSYDAIAPRVTIRGISQSTNTSPTTGAIFGNVSFADAYLPVATLDVNPFDLESVEVLKGPQGTLFGSSNLNGAIRYVPKAPVLGTFETKYYGQYTQIEGAWAPSYGVMVNAPMGEDMALRVMAFRRAAPGYIDAPKIGATDTNDLHQEGLRGILAWQPDGWDIGLTYAYQSTHTGNVGGVDNADGELSHSTQLRLSPQSQRYNLADLSIAYDFGWAKLVSETSNITKSAYNFLEGTSVLLPRSPIPLGSQPSSQDNSTFCEELRLSSPDERDARWHWMVGALTWQEKINLDVAINIDPLVALPFLHLPLDQIPGGLFTRDGVVLIRAITHARAREHALFGEVTRRLGERWEVTLGGRYYQTLSGGTNHLSGASILTQGGVNVTDPGYITLRGDIPESGFNPKASISYRATDNIMAFANTSRGYRVGGVQYGVALLPQPQDPVPEVFKSDTIWSYEGGLRTEWLDRTLRLDATGYLVTWDNPQYYTLDASGNSFYLTNVGGVKTVGTEMAFQYLTPWAVLVNITAAYANTVTTKEFKAPNGNDSPPGSPWPYSPKWQTAATLAYPFTAGSWNFTTGVTHTFLGKTIGDLSSTLPVYGFRQLDFNLSAEKPDIPWMPEINVSLNNALNERGIGNHGFNSTSHIESFTYIQPRTLNLRLTGHF